MSILECDYEEELKKIKKSYFERGEYDTIKIQISKKLARGITDPDTIADMLEIDVDTVNRIIEDM